MALNLIESSSVSFNHVLAGFFINNESTRMIILKSVDRFVVLGKANTDIHMRKCVRYLADTCFYLY